MNLISGEQGSARGAALTWSFILLGIAGVSIWFLLGRGPAAPGPILVPPPGSPSPAASGKAQTRYNLKIIADTPWGGGFPAETHFQVSGLLPNTTYTFMVGEAASWPWWFDEVDFTTDRRGKGSGKINWFGGGPGTAGYAVVDGADVIVLVGHE